jgi:large subunit ribosomal protein L35
MPKMKTKRGAAKRFRVTGSGHIKCGHANHSHNFTQKSRKRKRGLRGAQLVGKSDFANVKGLLPYA